MTWRGVKLSKEPTQNSSTHSGPEVGWSIALELYLEVNELSSKVDTHMFACASLVREAVCPYAPLLTDEQMCGFLQHGDKWLRK